MAEWITIPEFERLPVNQVFHRQLDKVSEKAIRNDVQNRHVLFRRKWDVSSVEKTVLRITADDYYKLYLNGKFVCQGPTASYPSAYNYNELDITGYLHAGENTIAVHTYYQGMINRVWVSGDNRHGLWLEMEARGKVLLASDGAFKTALHRGFSAAGIVGYFTQFMEKYDARVPECGFEEPSFDDSNWDHAVVNPHDDHKLVKQLSKQLVFEKISPAVTERRGNVLFLDFGSVFVGALAFSAHGRSGDCITIRCGQELREDGSVRYQMRANCTYEEFFILSGSASDALDQYDSKCFRYAELILPPGTEIEKESVFLIARHYPFELKAEFAGRNADEKKIWDLCVRTLHYGVQELIQDSMDREKGYYLGDGCYSLLTYCLLTKDYFLVEKFFDDFLATRFINRGLMTCGCCSMMQEIAEYPLIMYSLLLEYAVITHNYDFIRKRFDAFADVLDFYREEYAESDGLLNNLDKWCVVDWPKERQDGYDADVSEGKVCTEKHNVISAYYIGAIRCLNKVASMIGHAPYRDARPLEEAFFKAFHDPERHLFRDSVTSSHVSIPGNVIAWFFNIIPDGETRKNIIALVREKRLDHSLFFTAFPILCALVRDGEEDLMHDLLTDEHTWLNILREGGTATFEGWAKDMKWNTSLFHLTLAYGAAFLTPWPIREIFSL